MVVLSWGWHAEQRRQDAFAREFRICTSTRAPGRARATILGVVPLGGDRFDVAIQGDRAFAADAARGSVIEAAAQFRVLTHGAGPAATLTLRALERNASAEPIAPLPGPIELPVRITPDQTRASFWGARVAVEPLDDRTVYTHTFFDLFDLSPDHPRDVIHVGVSAADRRTTCPIRWRRHSRARATRVRSSPFGARGDGTGGRSSSKRRRSRPSPSS